MTSRNDDESSAPTADLVVVSADACVIDRFALDADCGRAAVHRREIEIDDTQQARNARWPTGLGFRPTDDDKPARRASPSPETPRWEHHANQQRRCSRNGAGPQRFSLRCTTKVGTLDTVMSEHDDPATVESSLRLGHGFDASEWDRIVDGSGPLTSRLGSFSNGTVELEISVKERGKPSQRTVLEAWIAGQDRLVATSEQPEIDRAIVEVRDDLIRQITDAKNRTEPRNRRTLRETIIDDQ